jgi:hypothetical protein
MDFEPGATKTSQMAADAAGCLLGQIAKSLVFVADGTPVLALVAGDRKGDAGAIAREVGASTASFADAVTVRDATGYAIGGVSPFDLPDRTHRRVSRALRRGLHRGWHTTDDRPHGADAPVRYRRRTGGTDLALGEDRRRSSAKEVEGPDHG